MEFQWNKLRPGVLTLCLNSTELGKVISERQLLRHRKRAGELISADGRSVDLLKYSAWLASEYIWKRYKARDDYSREQYLRKGRRRVPSKKITAGDVDFGSLDLENLHELYDDNMDFPENNESPGDD